MFNTTFLTFLCLLPLSSMNLEKINNQGLGVAKAQLVKESDTSSNISPIINEMQQQLKRLQYLEQNLPRLQKLLAALEDQLGALKNKYFKLKFSPVKTPTDQIFCKNAPQRILDLEAEIRDHKNMIQEVKQVLTIPFLFPFRT